MRNDEHPLLMLKLMKNDMGDIAHRIKNASP